MKGRATFFRPETIVAFHGVTFQSVIRSFFKTPVFGALLTYTFTNIIFVVIIIIII